MEASEKVKILQAVYAGALADAVLRMGREGVLEKVTREKRNEQLMIGKARAAQMGIGSPQEVFTKLSDLMGCADWAVMPDGSGDGFTASASRCLLCMMAKKAGAQSPCRIYCLDPMEGMVQGLSKDATFDVLSTLYDGAACRVAVTGCDSRDGKRKEA